MHTWPGGRHCFVIQVLFLIEAEEYSHALAITVHQEKCSHSPPSVVTLYQSNMLVFNYALSKSFVAHFLYSLS